MRIDVFVAAAGYSIDKHVPPVLRTSVTRRRAGNAYGEVRRMALIQWGVDCYTGLPEVDRQHEAMFALVNRLDILRGLTPG